MTVGRVDPVDKRTALGLGHRTRSTDDEDGGAIEIGVVNAHWRVQQADQVMHDGDHRLALDAGVAVGDLHGDLFVLAEQHRRVVLAVIDQRIVQSAIARPRIQRDVLEAVAFDHVDDDVGLPPSIGFLNGLYFWCWLCHEIFLLNNSMC